MSTPGIKNTVVGGTARMSGVAMDVPTAMTIGGVTQGGGGFGRAAASIICPVGADGGAFITSSVTSV